MESVTLSPLMRLTLRPAIIFREIRISSSSMEIPISRTSSLCRCVSARNVSSTRAYSAPLRITSLVLFCPRARLIDPIIIDFPAPVSPVNTFKQSEKSTSTSSMIAKFFTCKLTNTACSFLAVLRFPCGKYSIKKTPVQDFSRTDVLFVQFY